MVGNSIDPKSKTHGKFLTSEKSFLFKLMLSSDYVVLIFGIIAAVILGLSVPTAIFLVGEIVTLFIRNRRLRLTTLLEEGEKHTDYEQKTNENVEELAKELEKSVLMVNQDNNSMDMITFHNHSLREELNLNFELNDKFQMSLYTLCQWMLILSCCQFISAFITTFSFDLTIDRLCFKISNFLIINDDEQTPLTDEHHQSSETALEEDIQIIHKGFGVNFALLLSAFVTLIGCVGMAFYRRWVLALILIPVLLFNLFGKKLVAKLQNSTLKELNRDKKLIEDQLQETLNAVVTVVALRQECSELQRFASQLRNLEKFVLKNTIIEAIGIGMITMATHLLNSVMIWYGVRLIIQDLKCDLSFRPGTPVVVFFSFLRGLVTFNQSENQIQTVKSSINAIKRLNQTVMQIPSTSSNNHVIFPNLKINHKKTTKPDSSAITSTPFLIGKSAVRRLALHTQCSCNKQFTNKVDNGKCLLLELLYPNLYYIISGCVGSITLGASLPVSFYIFCEIIGAMANTEEEIVLQRSTQMLSAYSILATFTLLGTFLQTYMINIFCFRYGNKIRSLLLESFFSRENQITDSKEDQGHLYNLIQTKVLVVENALRNFFGTGVQIASAAFIALTLAGTVVWSQTIILAYIFPVLLLLYYFQHRVTNKKQNEDKLPDLSPRQKVRGKIYSSLLWGIVRAFREMVFATILFYGCYVIIHYGVNNKSVLQVNLIMVNTALQLNALINVSMNVKSGWKAAKEINNYLLDDKSNTLIHRKQNSKNINPELPLIMSFCDYPTFGMKIEAYPGQTIIIHVKDKKMFYQVLLGGQIPLQGKVLINNCNIRDVSINWIRSNIAIVSDEVQFLFPSRSLRENISYGNNFIGCSLRAIKDLPHFHDYHSELNSVLLNMSTSQKKKLILSRCLAKKTPIIIMDEDFLSEDFKLENEQILIIVRKEILS